jgi:leucyl aminopeptidase
MEIIVTQKGKYMIFSAKKKSFLEPSDCLIVFTYQKEETYELSEDIKSIDTIFNGTIRQILKDEQFKGSHGSTVSIYSHGIIPAKRIIIVGLGLINDLSCRTWMEACAIAATKSTLFHGSHIQILIPKYDFLPMTRDDVVESAIIGVRLGTYTFKKHQSNNKDKKETTIEYVDLLESTYQSHSSSIIQKAESKVDGVCLARDLINEPPSVTTPSYLASFAKQLVSKYPSFSCDILTKKEMVDFGMNGLLGIAQGSYEEPKFIILRYQSPHQKKYATNKNKQKTICIIGKGITFDSGGLSLKPSGSMETMKLDMSGGAAVLGIFHTLCTINPQVNVIGLIPATENMPGGRAIKPGDIVRAMNGKTIEILNTDAEGRIILADALSYAEKIIKPDIIIDVATLTGACVVALGEDYAGLFSNNNVLSESLKKAATNAGELLWQLPLPNEYKDSLKSTIADVKNITSSRYGGAITAALFLQEFVSNTTSWAHLDIAGPAFEEKSHPMTPHGGTGFGVLTLLNYILNLT